MDLPTLGRILHYRLRQQDVDAINDRRTGASLGNQGNPVAVGEVVPLVVLKVWPNEYGDKPGVNGQALLDGNDTLWVTSAREGVEPGQWTWPARS